MIVKCIVLFHFYGTWHSHLTAKKNEEEKQWRKNKLTTVNYKQIKRKQLFWSFSDEIVQKPRKVILLI